MNIRGFISRHLSSKTVRNLLSLKYKDNHSYKLIFGHLKGSNMIYRSDTNFRAILGLWEMDSITVMLRLFRKFELAGKKLIIADVGANMGYYSMFFSKYLAQGSEIFAFEPSSSIITDLRQNIEINGIKNVTVLDKAVSDHTGTEEFFIGAHHQQSSLIGGWADNNTVGTKTSVDTITLDEFFSENNYRQYPDIIKMDIEGGGTLALKGCNNCIVNKRPFILMESHTPDEDQAVIELLKKYNYEAFRIETGHWVLNKEINYSDPDGVWGTMLLMPEEKKQTFID
jgi:FkbM family methyltransferase